MTADAPPASAPVPIVATRPDAVKWGNVVMAALLMVSTLPGRTQGLGLITEPMLADLSLDRVTYANINLWATIIGSACCLPAGWLIDRWGLRWTTTGILLVLASIVWAMSAVAGGVALLFALVLLSRAFGQSALSVASITTAGKSSRQRTGLAMGVYAVLLSAFFAVSFVVVGKIVREDGWRTAWGHVATGLVIVAALVVFFLRVSRSVDAKDVPQSGTSLSAALKTPVFWVFAGGTGLFTLVSSGFGLFNQAILAERGFDQPTYLHFLAASTLFALTGQMLCGWLTMRCSMPRLLAIAMFIYAAGLAALPLLQTRTQLWLFAALFGMGAGCITVIFFAVWSHAFGRAQLGRIQGAAQMLAVFASALGPLFFAKGQAATGSYAPLLYALAPVVFCWGLIAWFTKLVPADSRP